MQQGRYGPTNNSHIAYLNPDELPNNFQPMKMLQGLSDVQFGGAASMGSKALRTYDNFYENNPGAVWSPQNKVNSMRMSRAGLQTPQETGFGESFLNNLTSSAAQPKLPAKTTFMPPTFGLF